MKTKLLLLVALLLGAFLTPAFADSAIVELGQKVTITLTVEKGTKPFTYQWYKDGVKIPDAVNDRWFIPSMSGADVGNYYCVVSNPKGSATSDSSALSLAQVIEMPFGVTVKTIVSPKTVN